MDILDHCTTNDVLHLILMPTEACNFRCTYCYEDFKLSRMEPTVVGGVERWIASRAAGLRLLRLTWFGGEPLLAVDLIERVLEHAHSLRARHPRMSLSSDITTNAYRLTRPVFERILGLGVTQYQISFDGPRALHDRKRVLASGRGTFDRIWKNLLATREVDGEFHITVRLHVDRENHLKLPEFIDEYNRYFASDPRYQLFVRKLSRFGGPKEASLAVLDGGPSGDAIIDGLRQRCGDHLQKDDHAAGSAVCYAAQANSYVVRADGRLNKCTIALNHPANQVGRLLEDGRVEVPFPTLDPWLRGVWNGDMAALECPLGGLEEALLRRPGYLPEM